MLLREDKHASSKKAHRCAGSVRQVPQQRGVWVPRVVHRVASQVQPDAPLKVVPQVRLLLEVRQERFPGRASPSCAVAQARRLLRQDGALKLLCSLPLNAHAAARQHKLAVACAARPGHPVVQVKHSSGEARASCWIVLCCSPSKLRAPSTRTRQDTAHAVATCRHHQTLKTLQQLPASPRNRKAAPSSWAVCSPRCGPPLAPLLLRQPGPWPRPPSRCVAGPACNMTPHT